MNERLIEIEADTVEQAERKLKNIDEFIHIGFNTPSACCGFIMYE